jgi:glycosyltransferase involved in cell wall biosynthesis
MKVVVSTLGRFHAFELARELATRNALDRFFTSYPAARAAASGVPRELVVGDVRHELWNRAAQRLQSVSAGRVDLRWVPCEQYDRSVASRLRAGPDIFLGWSGSSLASMRRARELGMRVFLERGSTHILHQQAVLTEEYAACGVTGRLPHPRTVERELREYEEADRIVVPTRFVQDTFVQQGIDPARILQVPYGVSLDSFYPTHRERGRFTIVHCGNVSLRKGCHHLLRAFRELGVNAELHFVGPVAREMKPFIERWGGPGVVFHGRVPQAELVHLYHKASVFCLASIEEGMAMVVPQAMACGLPVLATHESGAAEVVRDGVDGRLFKAGDNEALKEGILELLRHRERAAAMGRSAASRVRQGFRWSDYGERVHAGYETALEDLHNHERRVVA